MFDFRMSRGREGPAHFLDKFDGILQTDAYAAYDRWVGGVNIVHACCCAHARRRFVDAVKLNKHDVASIRAVELMDQLFAIDAQAREDNVDHARRRALRQEKAPALLDQIRNHILAMSKTVLPKRAAGQGCSYTLATWTRLTRFLDYPELELSNNLAENSMRPIALGRSNWIHIGSEAPAHASQQSFPLLKAAAGSRSRSVTLADILPGLANALLQRTAELTPTAWAARNPNSLTMGLL